MKIKQGNKSIIKYYIEFLCSTSEALFRKRMKNSQTNIKMKISERSSLKDEQYAHELNSIISFNSRTSWEKNLFDSDIIFTEDTPIISKKS